MYKRLLATLKREIILQYRYGFYYVTLFIVFIWVALFSQLPAATLRLIMPSMLLMALLITNFYFMGALVLLEKGENSLHALVVTPLRDGEFLAARIVSLTALALVENVLIVLLVMGFTFNLLWLGSGLILLAILYTLFGFLAIARYDAINEYLMPSVGIMILLTLPVVDALGWWSSPLFYLHPTQPPLLLLRAAFEPLTAVEIIYGFAGSFFWIGLTWQRTRRAFHQFIIRAAGA